MSGYYGLNQSDCFSRNWHWKDCKIHTIKQLVETMINNVRATEILKLFNSTLFDRYLKF